MTDSKRGIPKDFEAFYNFYSKPENKEKTAKALRNFFTAWFGEAFIKMCTGDTVTEAAAVYFACAMSDFCDVAGIELESLCAFFNTAFRQDGIVAERLLQLALPTLSDFWPT